jgi:hypothetical protein
MTDQKKNDKWTAWVNMMPGSAHTLHVVGTIDVGNESLGATIGFDCLEKSHPPILVLRISHQTIFIPRQPGDTKVLLHYQQPGTPGQYGGVIVAYPDGSHVKIDTISVAT